MSNNGKYLNLENGKVKSEDAIDISSGASDSSKIVKTNSNGLIDSSFIDIGGVDSIDVYDATGGLALDAIWRDVVYDVERGTSTSALSHNALTGEVTFNVSSKFFIQARVSSEVVTGITRSQTQMRVQYDSGSGYVTLPGTQAFMYNREVTEGKSTGIAVLIIDASAGDKIKIQAQRISGNNVATVAGGSSMTIHNLKGITGPKGETGDPGIDGVVQFRFGSGTPSSGLGADGDAYFDNDTGDYYTKSGGSWSFQFNAKGPAGLNTLSAKFTNNNNTTINAGTSVYNTINTTAIFDNIGANITAANDRFTINTSGVYCFYVNLYQTANSTRTNVGIEFLVNGVATGRISASAYIRNSGGHNETSTNLQETFVLSPGDFVQFNTIQLANGGTVTSPTGTATIEVKKEG
jgi:hypothetical protein